MDINVFASMDPGILQQLEVFLQPVSFPKGSCIMREGDPGDGVYVIDVGEVRVEARAQSGALEHELCYLKPGELLGEFSLLDGQPRSASAFAHTDVKARWFSREDFEKLGRENPVASNALLLAFSRGLTHKIRRENALMTDYLLADEPDLEANRMVAQAVAAQKPFVSWPEERVDALLKDVADAVAAHATELAEANVADTGIGVTSDKVLKIQFSCGNVLRSLLNQKASGVLREVSPTHIVEIASSVGVIFGVIPVTNPVSTIVFKTLIALKSRNALIYSCHRDAIHVGNMTGELIQSALARHSAPANLVQWVANRTDRRKTGAFMKHPQVGLILATGGPSIVEAAYKSGKPAIGVGAGNAPVWVCADADLAAAASAVVRSKTFDNGVICGSENNLVVDESVRAAFVRELEAQGAALLTADELHRFTPQAFDLAHPAVNRAFIGKSAAHIAQKTGLRRATPPRLIVVPAGPADIQGPYGSEKLAPILSLFTIKGEEPAIALCRRILEHQGIGHTAIIHTRSEALARRFGEEIPASRILLNAPGAQGCIGLGTGLTPSLTLGCGTFGGNSTTDNVTFTHLLNVKRLALGPCMTP
jgi:acetaldehyde dehydrogenase / alcohol dehydrogenase